MAQTADEQAKAGAVSGDTSAQATSTTHFDKHTPFTGDEYLESLRDGREIWIYGERVKDVTTHPAFRNTARMIARLYDALHDPARRDVLTHRDRHRQRRLHAPVLQGAAQRRGAGRRARRHRRVGARHLRLDRPQPRLQGGVPRHARRQRRLLRAVRGQRQRWYKKVQEEVSFVNHAIVNPPVDRDKPLDEVQRRLHARREGDRRRPDRQRREGRGDDLDA